MELLVQIVLLALLISIAKYNNNLLDIINVYVLMAIMMTDQMNFAQAVIIHGFY